MKKILYILSCATLISSCSSETGQLTGTLDREEWYQDVPYGMLFLPMGSYKMGPSDQEVAYSQINPTKTVSVQAFYMDETEVTNNEYRQFTDWVRDSIAHKLLEHFNEDSEQEIIDWSQKIKYGDPEVDETLEEMYYPTSERFYSRRQVDTRKLNFEYWWIDFVAAAARSNRERGAQDRSQFIIKDVINVYPDTLAWIHDFTYSFNEPMTQNYYWHPAYDDYPVVGVTWKQARAFSIWRTMLYNNWRESKGTAYVNDFRLPTESEWEYAARGGLDLSPYPWGGPYIRNSRGCMLGNFKPMRGNYVDDGGFHTVKANSYWPNDYGLYNMAGNAAEWTSNAFDETAYHFNHDLNANFQYEAKDSDPPSLKRKVIRGGSWKDIGYFIQTGTRSFEYQDTAKCYIGFRNVLTYLGRDANDKIR